MKTRLDIVTLLTFVMALGQSGSVQANDRDQGQIVDLSLIVAENYPCTWATGFPRFYMNRYIRIGPSSPYNSDLLQIAGNTGTQIDVPPHSIPRPGSTQWCQSPYKKGAYHCLGKEVSSTWSRRHRAAKK